MADEDKAFIKTFTGDQPDIQVDFHFNPTKYSVTKAVDWKFQSTKGGNVPPVEFVQGQGRGMTVELFLDGLEDNKDVSKDADKLYQLMVVDDGNKKDSGKARPPRVEFHWANGPSPFPAVIKSLNVTYTMFHSDGRPARATVAVTLQEVAKIAKAQNPTSMGHAGMRSHRVVAGETLDLIAYQELGSAERWRYIAELNHLDNPFAIKPGQVLAIAPLS